MPLSPHLQNEGSVKVSGPAWRWLREAGLHHLYLYPLCPAAHKTIHCRAGHCCHEPTSEVAEHEVGGSASNPNSSNSVFWSHRAPQSWELTMTAGRGWCTGQMLLDGQLAVPVWNQEQSPRRSLTQVSSSTQKTLPVSLHSTQSRLFACFVPKSPTHLLDRTLTKKDLCRSSGSGPSPGDTSCHQAGGSCEARVIQTWQENCKGPTPLLSLFFKRLTFPSTVGTQTSLLQILLSQLQLLQSCLCFISGLISPEGLAIDHFRRTMYWTDSGLDKIERARLDGSERRALFHTDLVNPRAIAVDPIQGSAGLP